MPTWAAPARSLPRAWRSRIPAAPCSASRSISWSPTIRTRPISAPRSRANGSMPIRSTWPSGSTTHQLRSRSSRLRRRRTASPSPARSGPQRSPERTARPTKPRGSTIRTRSPRRLRARWSGGARTPGSSSPSITRLATRLRPTPRAPCLPAAARCWAVCAIRSIPRISAPTCCRRRHPAPRSWRWPTAAAT
jgi:hypothetical protein